jgi:hypothetical protein
MGGRDRLTRGETSALGSARQPGESGAPGRGGTGQGETNRVEAAIPAGDGRRAHIFVLFQPIYQIGIRKSIEQIGLTISG